MSGRASRCASWVRGRWGGRWPAGSGDAGVATAIIDRAALAPMEHPDFDGRAYAIAAGPRRVLDEAGLWDRLPLRPGPILDIRVTDGRLGRPASRLIPAFRRPRRGGRQRSRCPGRGVGLDGGGAQPADGDQRAARRAAGRRGVRPGRGARGTAGDGGAGSSVAGGPTLPGRLVVAAEGRTSPLRGQAGIAGDAACLWAERHRLRDRARASASRGGAGAFPARRPVRPVAAGGQRGGGKSLRHRLGRARRGSRRG